MVWQLIISCVTAHKWYIIFGWESLSTTQISETKQTRTDLLRMSYLDFVKAF
jgi:hypothetical protein